MPANPASVLAFHADHALLPQGWARDVRIASQGGKAAHQSGNAHEFTSEEAREAGRKGGHASHSNRRAAAARNQSSPS